MDQEQPIFCAVSARAANGGRSFQQGEEFVLLDWQHHMGGEIEPVMQGAGKYVDLEIGLVYLELSHRLLRVGGRIGIVLPETYFFSKKYRWLPGWLDGRLKLRGMMNIPMEAFEEFCRAKTNFYIFEKIGEGEDVAAEIGSAS